MSKYYCLFVVILVSSVMLSCRESPKEITKNDAVMDSSIEHATNNREMDSSWSEAIKRAGKSPCEKHCIELYEIKNLKEGMTFEQCVEMICKDESSTNVTDKAVKDIDETVQVQKTDSEWVTFKNNAHAYEQKEVFWGMSVVERVDPEDVERGAPPGIVTWRCYLNGNPNRPVVIALNENGEGFKTLHQNFARNDRILVMGRFIGLSRHGEPSLFVAIVTKRE